MEKKIAVIGLGYVGLPLAVEFAKKYPTIGFDINFSRVNELMSGHDHTLEVEDADLKKEIVPDLITAESNGRGLYCTTAIGDIESANFYIVTVPTPTDKNKRPVLTPLIKASESVGKVLKKGDYIIYESTVYPGVTEDECVPVLEQVSGLKFNEDFFVGYSPERINPGDKERTVTKILKVTSGSTPEAAKIIDELYNEVITAGTHLAPSIKVAEAAKVIENSQRDINIAFVNELAKIFNKLDIDTHSVLEAAGTKWNFLPFKPGLVGGHCIGVDPYYLAQKAQEVGYNPEIILGGRRLNDGMAEYVANEVIKYTIKNRDAGLKNCRVLVLGLTFKENCPDTRNSKVFDLVKELKAYDIAIEVYDPWVKSESLESASEDIDLISKITGRYDVIVHAVAHDDFIQIDFNDLLLHDGFIYDLKGKIKTNQRVKRL